MSVPFFLVLILAILVTAAPTRLNTSNWFTVEWDAPEFTAMSGEFVVPSTVNNAGGILLVWPGLQGSSGVLQAELNGQSGIWTLGTSFYGAPDIPLGSRFQVLPGDNVHFSFNRISDSGLWTCTLTGPHDTKETFSLPAEILNRAIFAIDLSSVPHDFTVTYSNVLITASTSATDWCQTTASTGYGTEGYFVKDATAEGTTCRIGQIILPGTIYQYFDNTYRSDLSSMARRQSHSFLDHIPGFVSPGACQDGKGGWGYQS